VFRKFQNIQAYGEWAICAGRKEISLANLNVMESALSSFELFGGKTYSHVAI